MPLGRVAFMKSGPASGPPGGLEQPTAVLHVSHVDSEETELLDEFRDLSLRLPVFARIEKDGPAGACDGVLFRPPNR